MRDSRRFDQEERILPLHTLELTIGAVSGALNLVCLRCDGRGVGSWPNGRALLSDVLAVAQLHESQSHPYRVGR